MGTRYNCLGEAVSRRFYCAPTINVLSKYIKNIKIILMKFSIFLAAKNLQRQDLHRQDFVIRKTLNENSDEMLCDYMYRILNLEHHVTKVGHQKNM